VGLAYNLQTRYYQAQVEMPRINAVLSSYFV
jgi:hypothetical protein